MDELPQEIQLRIFTYLGDGDLLKVPLLNHYFNDLLHDESIWRNRMKKWIWNLEKPKSQITKVKYVEILRAWPREIKDATIRALPLNHDECLCKNHIYSDGNILRCFEYIPIEVLKLPKYKTPDIWIPLQFWFNRNPGLALPHVAIPYDNINIELNLDRQIIPQNDEED